MSETQFHPQTARMYLAVRRPRVIWRGRVAVSRGQLADGDPDNDFTIQVSEGGNVPGFDTVQFMPDLTAWIGTEQDGRQHGKCRVRRIEGNLLHVSADLSCLWEADDYISITDLHEYWPRPHKVEVDDDEIIVYKDHDLDASHRAEYPFVNIGPPACAFRDPDTGLATVQFDATRSFLVPPGSDSYEDMEWENQGITNYSWWIEGGTPDSANTSTVTVTYDSPGQYVVRCDLTGENGKTASGFRSVYIFDRAGEHAPLETFSVKNLMGDQFRQGWEAEIEVFGDTANPVTLPDGAEVVLFAEEWFAGIPKQETYGFPGRKNIKLVGYLQSSSLEITGTNKQATMVIQGLQEKIKNIVNFAVYVTQVDNNAPEWSYYATDGNGLTVRKAIEHLIRWHWTLPLFTDIYFPDEHNNNLPGQNFPEGSLGQQLDNFCRNIQSVWGISREGGLWIYQWPNTLAMDFRYNLHPTLLNLTPDDFESFRITPRLTGKASRVRVEGVMANGSGWSDPVVATAPGNVKAYSGGVTTLSNQVLGSEAQAKELARMTLSEQSRKIEHVTLKMCGNYSLCDVVPCSRVLLSITDTLRGLNWVERPFWVTGMQDSYDAEKGVITTTLTLLPEVFEYGVPVHAVWAQDLYDEATQEAAYSGEYAIARTLSKLGSPSQTQIVPAVLGNGVGKTSAGHEGESFVRLYGEQTQLVTADNRAFKEINDRPVWVEINETGSQTLYRVVGIRNPWYTDTPLAVSDVSRGFTTRIAVFVIPGNLAVGMGLAFPLRVLGSTLYARSIFAMAKVPPVGGSIVADVVIVGNQTIGSVSVGDGALTGGTLLSSEIPLSEGVELNVNLTQVGSTTPGADLVVEVECREYGL